MIQREVFLAPPHVLLQEPQPQQPQQWVELKNNTNIYVANLPLDVTMEELHGAFSKFGLIKEDENKAPRIKMYRFVGVATWHQSPEAFSRFSSGFCSQAQKPTSYPQQLSTKNKRKHGPQLLDSTLAEV